MKRLPIDIDMLVNLMDIDQREYDAISYLDTETGKIIFYQEDCFPDELVNCEVEREEITEELLKYSWMRIEDLYTYYDLFCGDESERFEDIPWITPGEKFALIEEFIYTRVEESVRDEVYYEISGRGAFSKFRTFLEHHGEYKDAWFKFESENLTRIAVEWLNSIGIDPIDTSEQ
ncbi:MULTISPECIES: UPF0158 family protein [unclassified Mesotoga]|jgi:hypothetical protein|uniref:UPF0158 family protein n=1 Tax=unclassified Mesotoga TaxID=1184398 RepID=UPI002600A5D6|nr:MULTISPECIES: UPF0158 family protein [unclassified Mesotoga]